MFDSLIVKLGLVAVLIAGLGLGALYIHHRGYEAGKASQASTIQALRDAAGTKDQAIAELTQANADAAKKYEANLAATKYIADAAIEQAINQQKKADSELLHLKNIYAHDPKARDWAVERVPSDVADSLHAAASDSH